MISNTTISAKYTVTAGVLQFSIPFRIYKTTDVSVFWSSDGKSDTPLTLGTDYSVAMGSEGGTVTLVSGKVPVGSILAIEPNFTATQETDLSSTTAISTEALEAQLDKQTLLILQQERRTGRAVMLPATSSESPEEVVQSIYASRDAAAASASAASTQATAAEASATEAASSADAAAQIVQNAAADAVNAATVQANAAAASATDAAQYAAQAEAASTGLAPRMDAAEQINTQQDNRLDGVEAANATQDSRLGTIEGALSGKLNADMGNLDISKTNAILQIQRYQTSAYATGYAYIPIDGTPPQITEGTQHMSVSITPKKSTSMLRIDVCMQGLAVSHYGTVACFKKGVSDALAARMIPLVQTQAVHFSVWIPSGNTSEQQFTVRCGSDTPGGQFQFNSDGTKAGATYGASTVSSITVTEYAA